MRTQYENATDLKNEAEAIVFVERWLRCRAKKFAERYHADFAMIGCDGLIWCFAEVKTRSRCFDPYWIGLEKWRALYELSDDARYCSLIVVRWPTQLAYVPVLPEYRNALTRLGGRTDRNRGLEDIEPMVEIPLTHFRPLLVARDNAAVLSDRPAQA